MSNLLCGRVNDIHFSAYLSSGVISARECVRATMVLLKKDKVEGERSFGIGRWIQELAWRDFYKNILAAFPRVSMGRPYLEKFSNVVWENHKVSGVGRDGKDEDDVDMLKRWKAGMTGVPIVDASMRCMNAMGWVHNRGRMIAAMFLTKDLMIDWRVGERVGRFIALHKMLLRITIEILSTLWSNSWMETSPPIMEDGNGVQVPELILVPISESSTPTIKV